MSALLIDQKGSTQVEPISGAVPLLQTYLLEEDSDVPAYTIVETINSHYPDVSGIIIQVCLKCKSYPNLQDCWGLEILKEIRANKTFGADINRLRFLPVILILHLPVQRMISINRGNMLALGTGIKRIHAPFGPQDLDLESVKRENPFLLEEFRDSIQVEINLIQDRHDCSNFFAAIQTLRLYCALFPEAAAREGLRKLYSLRSREIRAVQAAFGFDDYPPGLLRNTGNLLWKLRRGLVKSSAGEKARFKKIALIDDQSDRIHIRLGLGWKYIYDWLLYDNEAGVEIIDSMENPEVIAEKVSAGFDLVLLDLHLEPKDVQQPAAATKGALVLKALRKKAPMIPVIMTTASRNPEKHKALRVLGSDGSWIKENIDERLSAEKSAARIISLVEMAAKLTDKQYSLLTKSFLLLDKMKTKTLWWENWEWISERDGVASRIEPNKGIIFSKLTHGLLQFRELLQNKLLEEGFYVKNDESSRIAAIITLLGGIFEAFHSVYQGSSLSSAMEHRKDYLGKLLYRMRNQAAHFRSGAPLDFSFFERFLKGLFCYLLFPPPGEDFHKRNFNWRTPDLEALLGNQPGFREIYHNYFS